MGFMHNVMSTFLLSAAASVVGHFELRPHSVPASINIIMKSLQHGIIIFIFLIVGRLSIPQQ